MIRRIPVGEVCELRHLDWHDPLAGARGLWGGAAVTWITAMALLFVAVGPLFGQDQPPYTASCSLRVRVVDPLFRAAPNIPVTVMETVTKRKQQVTTSGDGTADFCDLGVFEVSVVVGRENCAQAVLPRFPIRWRGEHTTTIIFDRNWDPCKLDFPEEAGCPVVVRIRSANGNPIEGVELSG